MTMHVSRVVQVLSKLGYFNIYIYIFIDPNPKNINLTYRNYPQFIGTTQHITCLC